MKKVVESFRSILKRQFSSKYYGKHKILGIVLLTMLIIQGSFIGYLHWSLPDLSDLFRPNNDVPSIIYSADNVVLAKFSPKAIHKQLTRDEIPLFIQQAVVLNEDPQFFQHSGALFRGKSTLTIRLARHFYEIDKTEHSSPLINNTFLQKIKEFYTALYLERNFTKEEIITHYLNYAYFGGTIYGLHDAAKRYFDKKTSDLTKDEMALLVGILQAPSANNPRKFPLKAKDRRNKVLLSMRADNFLSPDEYNHLREEPVFVSAKEFKVVENQGLAPYFRDFLRVKMEEWCKKNNYKLYEDGLKIYTTIDSKIQFHAEAAMREHLSKHQVQLDNYLKLTDLFSRNKSLVKRGIKQSQFYKQLSSKGLTENQILDSSTKVVPIRIFSWNEDGYEDVEMSREDSVKRYLSYLESGLMTINPYNGRVLAYVGGMDYNFFQYDHVSKGKRQVGSTFKPIVYASAFDTKYQPCDKMLNQPTEIPTPEGDMWSPRNADGDYNGEVSLRYGLVHSINVVTAKLCAELGPEIVVDYAQKLGIKSPLKAVPAVALGSSEMTVAELTSSYVPFVANGKQIEPLFISRIEDRSGKIIAEFKSEPRRVFKETTAYTIVELLRGVATNGTAASVRYEAGLPYNFDMGGKTGTTQNSSDGWFVGFSPHLVTGVWVGCSDRSVNFGHSALGRGAYMAAPIWGKYMKNVYSDPQIGYKVTDRIPPPPNYNIITTCFGDPVKKNPEDESPSDSTAVDSLALPPSDSQYDGLD